MTPVLGMTCFDPPQIIDHYRSSSEDDPTPQNQFAELQPVSSAAAKWIAPSSSMELLHLTVPVVPGPPRLEIRDTKIRRATNRDASEWSSWLAPDNDGDAKLQIQTLPRSKIEKSRISVNTFDNFSATWHFEQANSYISQQP